MDFNLIKIIQLFFYIKCITGFICIGNFNFGCNPIIPQPIQLQPIPQTISPEFWWYWPYPGYEEIFIGGQPTSEPIIENTTKKPTKKPTKRTTKKTTKTPTLPPITFPPITFPPITFPPITIPPITVPPTNSTRPPITIPPIIFPPTNATTPRIPVTTDDNTWPWPGPGQGQGSGQGNCKYNHFWINRRYNRCWPKPTKPTFPPRPNWPSWSWWNRPRETNADGYWEPFDG